MSYGLATLIPAMSGGGDDATAPPNAPTGLIATPVNYFTISLSWTAPAAGEPWTSYRILRATTPGGPYTPIVTVNGTVTNYTDASLTSSTAYYYVVRAVNSQGESPDSAEATASTPLVTTPDNVTGFAADQITQSTLRLSWNPVTNDPGIVGYHLTTVPSVSHPPITLPVTPTEHTVTGLTSNTQYTFQIWAENREGVRSALPATITPSTLPFAPNPATNLADAGNGDDADLTWDAPTTDATHDAATDYSVQRRQSPAPFVEVANVQTTSYQEVVADGTYDYQVVAQNAGGDAPPSNTVTVTIRALPGPPTDLTAAAANYFTIQLDWVPPVTGAPTSYLVERGEASGGPYSPIANPTEASYTDANLTSSTAYYYVVLAVNATGASVPSNEATDTTPEAPTPAAVSGVAADQITETTMRISWQAGESDIVTYHVNYNPGNVTVEVAAPTLETTLSGLSSGTQYTVTVAAENREITGPPSTPITPTTLFFLPNPATNLADAGNGDDADLTWDAPAVDATHDAATGYFVERRQGADPFATAADVAVTNYSEVPPDGTYDYRVVAYNQRGEALSPSNVVTVTVTAPPVVPDPPTGLTAAAQNYFTIDLNWVPPAAGAQPSSYLVQRGEASGGPYSNIANPTQPSYTDANLTSSTTYYYVVRAVNATGPSLPSDEATDTTPVVTTPGQVTDVSADQISETTMRINWTERPADEGLAKYVVTPTPDGMGIDVPAPASNHTIGGLTSNTQYSVVVAAENREAVKGPDSVAITPMTLAYLPNPATNLIDSGGGTSADLSWTASVADATHDHPKTYSIERSEGGAGSWSEVGNVEADTVTYQETPAAGDWDYRVIAQNTRGNAVPSNTVSVTIGGGGALTPPEIAGLVGWYDSGMGLESSGSRDFHRADKQFYHTADNPVFDHAGDVGWCCWFRQQLQSQNQRIVSKYNFSTNQREFSIEINFANENLRVIGSSDGLAAAVVNYSIPHPFNKWVFVIGWFDAANQLLHLAWDNLISESVALSEVLNSTSAVRVGALDNENTQTFDGQIQNVVNFIPPTPVTGLIDQIRAAFYNSGNVPNLDDIKDAGLFATFGVTFAAPLNGRQDDEIDIANSLILTGNGTGGRLPSAANAKPNDKVVNLAADNPGTIVKTAADPSEDSVYTPNAVEAGIDWSFQGDGDTRRIELDPAEAVGSTPPLTVAAAVITNDFSLNKTIYCEGNTALANVDCTLRVLANGAVEFEVTDSAGNTATATSTTLLAAGVASYVLGDFDGSTARVFVAAAAPVTDTNGSVGALVVDRVTIASSGKASYNQNFLGDLFKVATFERLFTAPELTAWQSGTLPSDAKGLYIADASFLPSTSNVQDGGPLTRWLDQSARANHLSHLGVVSRPTWRASIAEFSGPGISFDGLDDLLNSLLALEFPNSITVVLQLVLRTYLPSKEFAALAGGGFKSLAASSEDSWKLAGASAGDSFAQDISPGTAAVLTMRSDLGGTNRAWRERVTLPSGSVNTGGITPAQLLNLSANQTEFDIRQLIIYDNAISDTDRDGLWTWLGI